MIDLHLHTTASDGIYQPTALVTLAARAGLSVISVTDHDTTGGLAEAAEAAALHGIRLVTGIEVTAVDEGRDVHVLGYFIDPDDAALESFLIAQRAERIERVKEIGARLAGLSVPIDVDAILEAAAHTAGRSVGRPLVADALIAAGHVVDRRDAFDRFLASGRPAFVPRCGPTPAQVIRIISEAGGLASLAHPGLTAVDSRILRYVESGLAALEARHREHDEATEARYRELADAIDLAVTGGSDFHGDGPAALGAVTLPGADFEEFESRLTMLGPPRISGAVNPPA